jgi:D-Tyr-tRNAtyr deacylase
MKAVIQRVTSASVSVDGEVVSSIGECCKSLTSEKALLLHKPVFH